MNLSSADLAELPLPAAVIDPHDSVIAMTPEWAGVTPGAVSYPVRRNRLVVSTSNIDPHCTSLLEQLLDRLTDLARDGAGAQAAQLRMVAGALRILAGRRGDSHGGSRDVLEMAAAGIAARTTLRVTVDAGPERRLPSPEVVALVLVQLAVNAEVHGGASEIRLGLRQHTFEVAWAGCGAPAQAAATARQRADRDGWGLGFARIAADTLGAALYPLRCEPDGTMVSTLELGLQRLALPLAAVRDGRVLKATRAWDEETGCLPGAMTDSHARLPTLVSDATRADGRLTVAHGWWARSGRAGTTVWVAVPPDDIVDRARDILAGLVHERALWQTVPQHQQAHVVALAMLLERHLGTPLPRVPAVTWKRQYAELAHSLGAAPPVPELGGTGAVDPRIVVHIAASGGARFECDGEDLYLLVPPGGLDEAVSRAFERRHDGALKLT
ncbi:MAG: hypothetical protein ABR541_02860 [Candidatus Dormibacteria bacterium]